MVKNHFASEFIYNKYKHTKTCGVVEHDPAGGIQKVAEPVGVIAGEARCWEAGRGLGGGAGLLYSHT